MKFEFNCHRAVVVLEKTLNILMGLQYERHSIWLKGLRSTLSLWKVSLKILNSGLILKTFTHVKLWVFVEYEPIHEILA